MIMRVAVIGLHWGHVHINAYRALGHDVVAVVDADYDYCNKVGDMYGIPLRYSSADELQNLKVDVVSVVVPAKHHNEVLRKVMKLGCAVICEKPVLGFTAAPDMYDGLRDDIFFNYAYPFLRDIGVFYEKLKGMGKLRRIEIECLYNLPLNEGMSTEEMFFETVSHPVALMVHAVPDIVSAVRTSETSVLAESSGGTEICIVCRKEDSIKGIRHRVTVKGSDELVLSGGFTLGSNWHYLPVMFNGKPVSGEYWPEEDPWYTANRNSIDCILRYFSHEQSMDDTLKAGAFCLKKAMIVENILNCLKNSR